MIAATECPTCGYDTADVELVVDDDGVVVATLCTCRLCGTVSL